MRKDVSVDFKWRRDVVVRVRGGVDYRFFWDILIGDSIWIFE